MTHRIHRYTCRVPLFEVDMGQAVYHGNYFHFFEQARAALLEEIGCGYPQLVAWQLHLAVVEAHCRYRRPVGYDDEILITTRVPRLQSRSLTFQQQLFKTATGELATDLTLNTVCISFAGKPVPLPQQLRRSLEDWLNSCPSPPGRQP